MKGGESQRTWHVSGRNGTILSSPAMKIRDKNTTPPARGALPMMKRVKKTPNERVNIAP